MAWYVYLGPGQMIATAVTIPIIGLILLALRLYSRHKQRVNLGIDDWLVVGAALFLTGMGISILYGVANKGIGYLTPRNTQQATRNSEVSRQVLWSVEWIQTLCLGSIKLSFVFFYRRIFVRKPVFNWISRIFIVILAVWTLGFFLAIVLECPGHPTAAWRYLPAPIHYAECWSTWVFVRVWIWTDVATDVVLITLPLPLVWKLNMSSKKKLLVTGAFLLGILALLASIIRAAQFMIIQKINDGSGFDKMMLISNTVFWCMIEAVLAILAVNLPAMYGGLRHINASPLLKKIQSYISSSSLSRSQLSGDRRKSSTTDVEQGRPSLVSVKSGKQLPVVKVESNVSSNPITTEMISKVKSHESKGLRNY